MKSVPSCRVIKNLNIDSLVHEKVEKLPCRVRTVKVYGIIFVRCVTRIRIEIYIFGLKIAVREFQGFKTFLSSGPGFRSLNLDQVSVNQI